MFKRGQIPLLWLFSSLLITSAVVADESQPVVDSPKTVEFFSDIRVSGPQGKITTGRIYVGDGEVRSDLEQAGQQLIQISSEKHQVTWLINPANHTYIERQGIAPGLIERRRADHESPCSGLSGAECKLLGDETFLGRPSRKWQVTVTTDEQVANSIQWIDIEHNILVRQESTENGPHMEQRMIGIDKRQGRTVEKWEMTLSQSNKPPLRSYRWYDPELNVVIREEHPGGFVQEMRNIRVSKQNPKLFVIPAGFSKVEQN